MGERLTKKATNGLVALSSAAIIAVYGAGYARTRAAADRFTAHATERRPRAPIARQRTTRAAADAATPNPEVSAPPLAPAAVATETPASEAKAKPAAPERSESPRNASVSSHTTEATHRTQAIHATEATRAPEATEPTQATRPTETSEATQAIQAPQATPATQATKYRDGTYLGWGTSPHGDIQAAVIVEGGRITTAKVAQCLTRYSCAWIAPIPPVIIEQQGTTYDYVSGATESSDAFQNAVADALSHAL